VKQSGKNISLLCFTYLAANAPEDDFSGELEGIHETKKT
jgi:hypothetical protein